MKAVFQRAGATLWHRWRELCVTDLFFKAVSFTVLTPLAVALLRGMLWLGGVRVLADTDLVMVCLQPAGAIGGVLLAAVWLGILALEQASLLALLANPTGAGVVPAIRFALLRGGPVLMLTARLVVMAMLVAAPFMLVAGLVFWWLLGAADINYYLQEWPREFQLAMAVAAGLGLILAVSLLRLFADWLLALPLLLLAGNPPGLALAESRRRLAGKQWQAFVFLASWTLAVFLAIASTSAVVVSVGSVLSVAVSRSLPAVMLFVGLIVLVWMLVNLLVQVLAAISFAALLEAAAWAVLADSETSLSGSSEAGGSLHNRLSVLGVHTLQRPQPRLCSLRSLCLVAACGCLLALTVGAIGVRNVWLPDNVEIMGHRGAAGLAPENSMAAVEQAIAAGADWVEIDVQESAEGEVIVTHDSDFMKVAGIGLKVWEATQADLASIDIGSRFDSSFSDQRVPSLHDLLTVCHDRIGVIIELKSYGHGVQLEQRVVEIVEANGGPGQVMVMSLDREVVRRIKALRPAWKVGLLLSVAIGDKTGFEADFLAINARFVSRRLVRQAHRAGKQVFAWTVNDAVSMSRMVSRGVDGLITDRPDRARKVLDERARYSPAERLLLELAGIVGVDAAIVGD